MDGNINQNAMKLNAIGKTGLLLAMASEEELPILIEAARCNEYRVCMGQAGSMEFKKIIAAIETAAVNEKIVGNSYWEKHALYHAVLESFHGISRGEMELGSVLRTVGIRFAIVRGKRSIGKHSEADADDGKDWISVALYGTIGAPIKGSEHEVVGLGINHI